MKPIFVTRTIPHESLARLRQRFEVDINAQEHGLTPEELRRAAKGRQALITLLSDVVDDALLEAAGPQLRIVANVAVGYNNFDVDAATRRGVILTNTPGVLDDATATLAFALLLAAARRVPEGDRYIRAGRWTSGWSPGFFVGLDVDGKTLGIAGLGRIGKNLARKAQAFGMPILYTHPQRQADFEREIPARHVDKATLLRESDFLSLHVPLRPETRHYIGAAELALMKPMAVLINAARGPVVDEKALVDALKARRIWGAGLDVFENEPTLEPGLAELDNVVMVPHIGSATVATRQAMGDMAVRNVIKVLDGEPPETCINPDVLGRPG